MSWRDSAACLGVNPDWFFPNVGEPAWRAKAICARCPVKQECRDYAYRSDVRYGIWGGVRARQARGWAR